MRLSLVILFLFFVLTFIFYSIYKKSAILDINIKNFNKAIIFFELGVISIFIYGILVQHKTQDRLAEAYSNKLNMIQAADSLRQSSDDLSKFARLYLVTADNKYKKYYKHVLDIRNGIAPRPVNYNMIYWDLKKHTRDIRHPDEKKESLKSIIKNLPFSSDELAKLLESESNSNTLVNLEVKAFKALEDSNQELGIKLLFSQDYMEAKSKIMLPIDEMMESFFSRVEYKIIGLNKEIKNQFIYLFTVGLLFIIGNILIYVLLVRKLNIPIEYLTDVIRKFKDNSDDIEEKMFYKDEIGIMNREFFSMKNTIKEQTNKLEDERKFIKTLLDSQEQIIITTDGSKLLSANKTFYDFFMIGSIDEFNKVYNASCICDVFKDNTPSEYLPKDINDMKWIDYVISNPFKSIHKTIITKDDTDFVFSIAATTLPVEGNIKSAILTDITDIENAKKEIEAIHKHTKDSIEYASFIQAAIIPDNKIFRKYFSDYFAIWHPKDVVGGDIYLFEELRSDDECLIMLIDCTGHGVPGAFVTMLVKAIERQIVSTIINSDEVVNTAKILSIFNKSMKHLLKQDNKDSLSNVGFDGGIIYFNKKEKVIKYSGANTPLFYVKDDKLNMIKGDRYSVGYKKCDTEYNYTEHIVEIKDGMQFYLSTDGYLDQNGGKKGFPFGKKRFKNIIEKYHTESMADHQEIFLNELSDYEDDYERNDDVTLIGFTI